MDARNLETASQYVNNLLLSRGWLRNGEPIDFAKSSSNTAAATIINLVHDLVLRKDRDTEALTNLSQSLSTTRTAAAQNAQQVSKLETRNAELERQLSLAQAQERAAKASLKTAESRNKALREDLGRLKASVSTIRSRCANEIRKRDTEMKRLQKYLEVKRGREGSAPVGVTVIIPGAAKPTAVPGNSCNSASVEAPSYSLKEETTEFLTQLSQSLSDENDALINLIQMTLATLRSLQGLPDPAEHLVDDNGITLNESTVANSAPPSYENMATDMDDVLEHLRGLLTNPSFVPLEEVQVREDEIVRLQTSFEKMESKLKDALGLMKAWRKRMMDSGDAVDLDDLRRGLSLDASSLSKSTYASINEDPREIAEDSGAESFIDEDFRMECELAANHESPVIAATTKARQDALFPAPEILRSTSGNARRRSPATMRKVSFHANSPKIGALVDALDDGADEIALIEAARSLDAPTEPEWTVAQKLENAKIEAESAVEQRKPEPPRTQPQPVKRSAIPKKTRSKRRSTLSPQELEGLMGM